MQESEGSRATFRFCSIRVREGGRRRRVMRQRDERAVVASVAEGRRRSGDGPAWAKVGHTGWAADGPARKIKSWAAMAIRPN
jgi:hypothetical protein